MLDPVPVQDILDPELNRLQAIAREGGTLNAGEVVMLFQIARRWRDLAFRATETAERMSGQVPELARQIAEASGKIDGLLAARVGGVDA